MERRRFIATAGGAVAAAGAAAVVDAPHVIAQPKVQWRLPTAFRRRSTCSMVGPSGWRRSSTRRAAGGSGSRCFPGGRIMRGFECFDAASQGRIEAFHSGE